MKLLDDLRREHETIEAVASAFVAFASRPSSAGAAADGELFLRFFRVFAGRYHHGREEQVLFPALVRETAVPADRGPLRALLDDHRAMASDVGAIAAALATGDPAALRSAVMRYVSALLRHVDAETSVLFPESEARFRRACVTELPAREPDDEERAAREDGLRLVERWGSATIPGLSRGDGCACCPSFGVSCDGVEREWSSDLEWEDMLDRVGR
jgi:hemerythrin-like domain-containing protein